MADSDIVDVSGAFWPVGIPVGQTWREIGCLLGIIQAYNVTTFIEVGVDQGGLAALLMANRQIKSYTGLEINAKRLYPGLEGIDVVDAWGESALQLARSKIVATDQGRALVYCDGGDKPREVMLYAPLLRRGDIIGVHDFTIEIQESDLPAGDQWIRLADPWLAGTRQVFLALKG